jgi:hypothetical protein
MNGIRTRVGTESFAAAWAAGEALTAEQAVEIALTSLHESGLPEE